FASATAAGAAAIAAWRLFSEGGAGTTELFGVRESVVHTAGPGMIMVDRLSSFFRLLLMVFLAGIIGMWAMFDRGRERRGAEFLVLLLSSAVGMCLLAGSSNLLLMIVAIETASMPSYALAAFDRSRRAAEAAMKYALFGAVTTGLAFFGASLLFGAYGTLHVPTLAARIFETLSAGGGVTPLLCVALLTLFATIGFKISAVPVHFWCPDVFEGAPLPIATWLSVASKAAAVILLLRLTAMLTVAGPELSLAIAWAVGIVATVTFTFANIAAYKQDNIRRLLAYSSIAHAGYMIAAAMVIATAQTSRGAAESAIAQYILVYMFMNFGAFLALGLVAQETGSESIQAFDGIGWRKPMLGMALAMAISRYYYARLVKHMYLRRTPAPTTGRVASPAGVFALAACSVFLLLTGTLLIGPLKSAGDSASVAGVSAAPAASIVQGK
ncbi:MAG: hypothetical protein HZB38_06035, partial [Planctomycetes bacterium]|nr:hypothetical protein [Planctomycetota bacterium]